MRAPGSPTTGRAWYCAVVKTLDVVVPAYNEEDCLRPLWERLRPVLDGLAYRARVIFVDDGSSDATADVARELAREDPRIGLLRLSRNFGHQAALTAGLDAADADVVVTMDADLQHPPEVLPEFLAAWEAGAEVVSGVRVASPHIGALKRWSSAGFYRLLNAMAAQRITLDSPDFRLFDRKVVEAIGQVREQGRFLRGIYTWVGFRQVSVPYTEGERVASATHYRTIDMLLLALAAVLSFSRMPLRFATYLGLLVSGLAFAFGIYALAMNLIFHQVIRGWTSLAVLVSFLSGVQLLTLGVLGEYVGQVLDEAKRRPLYILRDAQIPPFPAEAQTRPELRR